VSDLQAIEGPLADRGRHTLLEGASTLGATRVVKRHLPTVRPTKALLTIGFALKETAAVNVGGNSIDATLNANNTYLVLGGADLAFPVLEGLLWLTSGGLL
jgi:hypothetical protein